jgi:NAD(P)-dependent dehydrogenase (short-subunit alcohol dehydrogenase family)
MTPFHLTGKTILVTGASSGIGRQVCISASKMGAIVVLSARNESRLNETFALLEKGDHRIITADITSAADREKLAREIPALDGIVHCSGFVTPFPVKFLTQEKMDETMNLNYEAPVLLIAAFLKAKKISTKASIVLLSSISGQHPHKGGSMYGSSKAALESFAKVLALELYPQGVRVNCISPGMVKTPLYEKAEQDSSKETMDAHVARYPLGPGLPEDVANAAIYLLSPASRWVTGINLVLDGGFLLGG